MSTTDRPRGSPDRPCRRDRCRPDPGGSPGLGPTVATQRQREAPLPELPSPRRGRAPRPGGGGPGPRRRGRRRHPGDDRRLAGHRRGDVDDRDHPRPAAGDPRRLRMGLACYRKVDRRPRAPFRRSRTAIPRRDVRRLVRDRLVRRGEGTAGRAWEQRRDRLRRGSGRRAQPVRRPAGLRARGSAAWSRCRSADDARDDRRPRIRLDRADRAPRRASARRWRRSPGSPRTRSPSSARATR